MATLFTFYIELVMSPSACFLDIFGDEAAKDSKISTLK